MDNALNREQLLFEEALRIDSEAERAAFLDAACQNEPQLRSRVEALINGHLKAEGFLETPPAEESVIIPAVIEGLPLLEKPGDLIGRYKLLERIGEGGFGVVYMAEQKEPIKRRVALKIIKLGMDTRQVVTRFEAERQALAVLDHPNIAKVFDAGATESGRPYFVMELIRGVPITQYCDENGLPPLERLSLFTQVCHAIQHAHQKGIIHRDIKPSNILVALHDGVPAPKVIDFGVAKATQQELTEKTLFTQFQQFIGTPAYMSPEQAGQSGLDIDTRSDIYALGVLLYELLTGRTPFDPKSLVSAGVEEMRRIIREEEPVRPSARLSTLADAERTAVARQRSSEAPALIHVLRGDLDWIVMKCLEKDRQRRYETANGLAEDIQRHLNCEAVVARPPAKLYRLNKLIRRNKGVFAGVGAVAAALVLGLCVSLVLYWREGKARQRAVEAENHARVEAGKSEQVAKFLGELLHMAKPSVAQGRDTKLLREMLERAADRVDEELAGQPEVEAELRRIIGEAFEEVGAYSRAEEMAREALKIERTLHASPHDDVADSLEALGAVLSDQGKKADAEAIYRECLEMRQALHGREHLGVALALNNLGAVLAYQGRNAEAEALSREALAIRKDLLGYEDISIATSLDNLAGILVRDRRVAEAAAYNREALAIRIKRLGNTHPDVGYSLGNLAVVLEAQGDYEQAEAKSREALAVFQRVYGREHPDVAVSLCGLAEVLMRQKKWAEAEPLVRESLAISRKFLGSEHRQVTGTIRQLAQVLQGQGRLREAQEVAEERLAILRKILGNLHPEVAGALCLLAEVLKQDGKSMEAEPLYREALAIKKSIGPEDLCLSGELNNFGLLLQEHGEFAEAEECYRSALAISERVSPEHEWVGNQLANLAALLWRQEKMEQAEPVCQQALALRKKAMGPEDPRIASDLRILAEVLRSRGKPIEAEAAYREAMQIHQALGSTNNIDYSGMLNNMAMAVEAQGKKADAELLYRQALSVSRKLQPDHPFVVIQLRNLAEVVAQRGNADEAEVLRREAEAIEKGRTNTPAGK